MPSGRTIVATIGLIVAFSAAALSAFTRVAHGVSASAVLNDVMWVAGFAVFASVGALVVVRRPEHPIGVMFLTAGLLGAVGEAADAVAALRPESDGTIAAVAGWMSVWVWAPSLGLVVWSLLLFPTGRALNRGLGALGVATFAITISIAVVAAVEVWPLRSPALVGSNDLIEDTFAHDYVMAVFPLVLLSAIVAMASVVARYRRSTGVERQQLKWLAAVAFVAAVSIALGETVLSSGLPNLVTDVLSAPMWLAVAVGFAILRYRLYDIDRIITRTLSYTAVTAILLGVYAGGVLALSAVTRAVAGDAGDLVVALSTLLVAALFAPVRRRVQATIDRHFNRSQFDAMRAADEFGRRLRREVDLDAVSSDLRSVVMLTLEPSWVSVTTANSRR